MKQSMSGRGRRRERGGGFKKKMLMMLLWMDVTQTNRHVCNNEERGLLEKNKRQSRRELLSVGVRTML